MPRYFESVPSAAVRREVDGNLYAYASHTVKAGGIAACEPRMLRVDPGRVSTRTGIAQVYIGAMGHLVAQRVNLPFSVHCEED